MSYLVLARKWRPTTFDEVIGQEHVTQTLKNAIELNRVAHALLFTGSRGIGKTTCARILSKALNCEDGPTTTPCGTCPACDEITSGTSVDVFEIDGASNNSVEQIREIRESVKFMPAKGRRKVYIIDEVHMLSTSAFNALLKTLEEPPEHVLFVFATTEPHKIPDTIHSRCQRYDFKRIPERTIVEALQNIANAEGLEIEESALFHVAREAQGGMRDSLSLLDQVIAYCGLKITETQTREVLGIADRAAFSQLVSAIITGDGQGALRLVETQFRRGLDLQKFAAEFVRHVRDLVVVKVCPDASDLVDVPPDELSLMASQVANVSPPQLHRILNTMLKGAEEVSRSPFPKLVLEMTLLRLCSQGVTLPLSEVLDGISRLEQQLGAQGHVPAAIEAVVSTQASTTPVAKSEPTFSAAAAEPPKIEAPPVQAPAPEPPSAQGSPADMATPQAATSPVHVPVAMEASKATPEPPAATAEPPAAAPEAPASAPEPPASESAPLVEAANPQQGNETGDAGGFKRRPTGELEYDDLSAPPVQPLPIESLRPLKVKARVKSALPMEEVEPFVVEGPPPLPMADGHEDLPADEVNEAEASDTPAVESPPEDKEQTNDGLLPPWVAPESPQAQVSPDGGSDPVEDTDKLSPSDGRSAIEHFGDLLNLVRADDSFLASELEQSLHLVSFENGVISVATSAELFAQLGENSIEVLERVAQQSLTPPHELIVEKCMAGDDRLGIETLFERKNRLEQEARRARRDSAATAPGVVNASQLLNAEIIDVQLVNNDS